ncbi:MAG TPA: helix-turn-helix domain-containing protein [Gemmatimonadaceae bacterium]|nr:helix-turn-helix domain-containing protein [Gemmatimonadaceae bacterium]
MQPEPSASSELAVALRRARRARGVSIASLAAQAGVSARLVSEFEQQKRPHVSLETALRLLRLVDVEVAIAPTSGPPSDSSARSERARVRRATWAGVKSTLAQSDDPAPPASPAARLAAVADVSRLAYAVRRAAR